MTHGRAKQANQLKIAKSKTHKRTTRKGTQRKVLQMSSDKTIFIETLNMLEKIRKLSRFCGRITHRFTFLPVSVSCSLSHMTVWMEQTANWQ